MLEFVLGKMGDHSSKGNIQLQKFWNRISFIHIIWSARLKFSETIWPYFKKYKCSSLVLWEVAERRENVVLRPTSPLPVQIITLWGWEFTGPFSGFQK